jgi:FkbM family methyltransferase
MIAYRNGEMDPARNGEYWLLRTLGQFDFQIVFDVGANRGEWASEASRFFPHAVIHAFEISPETFRHLAASTAADARIRANAFGLAEEAATVRLHVSPANDKVSSLLPIQELPYQRKLPWTETEAKVRAGDEYCREADIEQIGLLKIDVEGAENRVIAGFSKMIEGGRIDVIQFEYGQANIHSRFLLLDYYRYLGQLGYQIGKLMPRWVSFKSYAETDEDFMGLNYIAVHESRPDIIRKLDRTMRE